MKGNMKMTKSKLKASSAFLTLSSTLDPSSCRELSHQSFSPHGHHHHHHQFSEDDKLLISTLKL